MELEQSALYREVAAIITSGANPVHFHWSAVMHANGQDYAAQKVSDIDINRDYESNYSDQMKATLVFNAGDYWASIYPYSDSLEITLTKTPLGEVGDSTDLSQPVQTERYMAILDDKKGSPLLTNTGMNTPTQATLNYTGFETVSVELVDKGLYQMNMRTTGGIFRATTNEKVLRAIMTTESQKVQVNQKQVCAGVNIVTTSNQNVRDHVVIPQGTPIVHVPMWLHEKCGGVYSAGMGYYYQNEMWYFYPCYDPIRSGTSAPSLTIINVPKNKFTGAERTYRQSGDNTVILATGDVKFRDQSNTAQLNKGNGVRFADASKIFDNFVTVKSNMAIASRGNINNEAITVARPNGLNNAQQTTRSINANPFIEYSNMAKRNGSVFALTWENSNPPLITPGMLCTVLYIDQENISQVQGVVLKVHHHVRMQGQGMTSNRHVTDTGLSIFTQRPVGNGVSTGPGVVNAGAPVSSLTPATSS
jgi:hypothetical protein